jgi:hypothetical protein
VLTQSEVVPRGMQDLKKHHGRNLAEIPKHVMASRLEIHRCLHRCYLLSISYCAMNVFALQPASHAPPGVIALGSLLDNYV